MNKVGEEAIVVLKEEEDYKVFEEVPSEVVILC